jgi:hypothetical protein
MTQNTFEVFKWSGTYYNASYNTSYTAVVDDDDNSYEGGGDSSEKISIDGGAFTDSSSSPYAIDVGFEDTGGNTHVETFYFMNTGGNWYFAPGPDSEFTVGAKLGSYKSHTVGWDYADVACFVAGTLIDTGAGPVAVENLQPGALVRAADDVFRPLLCCLHRYVGAGELSVRPKLRPVRICKDALGDGLPRRDLLVSRQHRMLIRSVIAQRMFGQPEVLIPAIRLTALPGIFIDPDVEQVTYYHLLFDQHEVVFAESAPSESLFTGGTALDLLDDAAMEELSVLFPGLADRSRPQPLARPVPPLRRQNQLIARHHKNAQPLVV